MAHAGLDPAGDVAEIVAAFEARDPEEVARSTRRDRCPVTAEEVRSPGACFAPAPTTASA